MNFEELTWFNQQLAAMLREGLPLSGALKQLTESQRHGRLREEYLRLEAALAAGQPLEQAVAAGALPPLYVRLVQAGARSGDLPGALTMAADHYAELNAVWRRTKALLFYPALVILVGFGLSLLLWQLHRSTLNAFSDLMGSHATGNGALGLIFLPLLFALIGTGFAVMLLIPSLRNWLVWRLPGFREARTANLAGSLALMLRHGCPLPEALALVEELEQGSPAEGDLRLWQQQLRQGETDLTGRQGEWRAVPALLGWFIRTAGNDLAAGLQRAAQFYRQRSNHHLDLLLHGALPILLVLLGMIVTSQVFVLFRMIVPMIDKLGGE
jgi:type II secretory pathway component PulF